MPLYEWEHDWKTEYFVDYFCNESLEAHNVLAGLCGTSRVLLKGALWNSMLKRIPAIETPLDSPVSTRALCNSQSHLCHFLHRKLLHLSYYFWLLLPELHAGVRTRARYVSQIWVKLRESIVICHWNKCTVYTRGAQSGNSGAGITNPIFGW